MSLKDPLLSRRPHKAAPHVTLWGEMRLPLARVHEICGRARRTLALHVAAQAGSPVLWIAPDWGDAVLHAPGMTEIMSPGDVTFVAPTRAEDALWCMEEALRAGCVPMVVAELTAPPAMTPVRRLHLAAEAGAARGLCKPLGVLLTPGDGGAAGVETRFSLDPAHVPGRDIWYLQRRRARLEPPRAWHLENATLQPASLADALLA